MRKCSTCMYIIYTLYKNRAHSDQMASDTHSKITRIHTYHHIMTYCIFSFGTKNENVLMEGRKNEISCMTVRREIVLEKLPLVYYSKWHRIASHRMNTLYTMKVHTHTYNINQCVQKHEKVIFLAHLLYETIRNNRYEGSVGARVYS